MHRLSHAKHRIYARFLHFCFENRAISAVICVSPSTVAKVRANVRPDRACRLCISHTDLARRPTLTHSQLRVADALLADHHKLATAWLAACLKDGDIFSSPWLLGWRCWCFHVWLAQVWHTLAAAPFQPVKRAPKFGPFFIAGHIPRHGFAKAV